MSALIIMKVVIIVMLVFPPWGRGGSLPQGGQVSSIFIAGHSLSFLAQVVSLAAPGSHRTCRFVRLLFINVMNWLYTSGISAAHL